MKKKNQKSLFLHEKYQYNLLRHLLFFLGFLITGIVGLILFRGQYTTYRIIQYAFILFSISIPLGYRLVLCSDDYEVKNVKKKNVKHKGWLSRLFDNYLENGKEEIKNGTTKVYIWGFVALMGIAMVGIVGFYVGFFASVSNAAAAIGKDNPELIAGMMDEDFAWASLAKQIPMEIDIEGDFQGKFTNKTARSLEKKDLECIDKYNFVVGSRNWTSLDEARMLDPDCIMFSAAGETVYYQCPERNCEKRVVNRTVSDEFIPTTMQVTKISIKTGR